MKRKIQYYKDKPNDIWSFWIKGEKNPCKCGSNCFHHQYDGNEVYCVCNSCGKDIYTVIPEYKEETLSKGIWK